jgi:regulator of replication initiation timing
MGDGIGGPVMDCLSGNMFKMYVTHFRKDNSEEYSKLEKIQIVKVENDPSPQTERTLEDLEQALKGKFVTCNVQYRDKKTDVLFCNVFIQNPPEGF